MQKNNWIHAAASWILSAMIISCAPAVPLQVTTPSPINQAHEITYCGYTDDMPQVVLDEFTSETGIKVTYRPFDSQELSVKWIETKGTCDVSDLDNRYVFDLAQNGFLAKLNMANLTNIKNISANFRDMVYDPQNAYTVPYNWGTTGLLFRSDLVQATRWSDFWNSSNQGKIGLSSGEPRDTIGLALKSLGYSANSENPAEVNAAVDRLIELKPKILFLNEENQSWASEYLKEGKVVMAVGYSADAVMGRDANPDIHYILPEEGAMLWGENFVIPANSANQPAAEMLLNYFLRPEVSAKIANLNLYATPNQAAFEFIEPEILRDPVIFPTNESLQKAEIILQLSPQGHKLWDQAWARFLDTVKSR